MYKFQPKDFQDVSTAYHEATHALFAILAFFKIEKVEIFSNKKKKDNDYEACGVTSFFSHLDYTSNTILQRDFAISEIIVNYSGVVGEQFLFKQISGVKKAPGYIKKSGYVDNNNSKKIFKKYLIDYNITVTAFKASVFKKIESILESYWEDVKLIAISLLFNKKLKHNDIKNILTKKSKSKHFWKQKFKVIDIMFGKNNIVLSDYCLMSILQTQEKLW